MATHLAGVPYAAMPTAAKAASPLAWPPRLVVIHDTSNDASAAQEAAYAASRPLDGATSAHFYVDGTGPLGSVPLNRQAWAAYRYANTYGWHVEMCGYNAGMRGAVPAKTIGITAWLVRQLCALADIPMVKLGPDAVAAGKRGICGHWDITTGLNVGTHDDPGPAFDWPAFIAAVKEEDMPLTQADAELVARAVHNQRLGASSVTIGQALQTTVAAVTGMLPDLVRQAIQAASDDPDVDVTLTPEQIAALGDAVASRVNVEAAVREVFADAGQAE